MIWIVSSETPLLRRPICWNSCGEGTRAECQTSPRAPMISAGFVCVLVWAGLAFPPLQRRLATAGQLITDSHSSTWHHHGGSVNLLSSPAAPALCGLQKGPRKLQQLTCTNSCSKQVLLVLHVRNPLTFELSSASSAICNFPAWISFLRLDYHHRKQPFFIYIKVHGESGLAISSKMKLLILLTAFRWFKKFCCHKQCCNVYNSVCIYASVSVEQSSKIGIWVKRVCAFIIWTIPRGCTNSYSHQ